MADIKNEKVLSNQLALGMFVSELDKPWLESDFLLQGFVIEEQTDLDKLVATCAYVYVDRTRSIGNQFVETKKTVLRRSAVKIKAPVQSDDKKTPKINKVRHAAKISFIDILREVRGYRPPTNTAQPNNTYQEKESHNSEHRHATSVFQTTSADNYKTQIKKPKKKVNHRQHNDRILSNLSGFVAGLFNRYSFKKSRLATDEAVEDDLSEAERIAYELEPSVEEEMANIYPAFQQTEIVTRDMFDAIANENQLDISSVSDVLDNMVESIGRTPDALLWLAKLKKVDGHSYNLALNVSVTLMAFNSFLALPKEQVKLAGLAGLLQDIGKVKISPDVLLKKGKLTAEEYRYAKTHVDESLAILEKTPNIPKEVMQLVAEHHERFNGSGYPSNLKGDQLSLLSQSTGLIDTYCAMTNHRVYAEGTYHQQALDQIHSLRGKLFSNEIIDQLIQFMGIYPVSSLVELNTGEVAVVIQQNQVRRLMPRVMLLLDQNKERYISPIVLDLIYQPSTPTGEVYTINKGIPADSYGLNPNEFYV